jgi:hypothetical protein
MPYRVPGSNVTRKEGERRTRKEDGEDVRKEVDLRRRRTWERRAEGRSLRAGGRNKSRRKLIRPKLEEAADR